MFIENVVPDNIINIITKYGLSTDSPNLKGGFNMALSQMELHMGHIDLNINPNAPSGHN